MNNFHYTGEEEVLADKINEIIDYLESKGGINGTRTI